MIVTTSDEKLRELARELNKKLKDKPALTMDELFDTMEGQNKHGVQSKDCCRWVAYVDNLIINCLPEYRLSSERLIRAATLQLISVNKIDEAGLLKMVDMMLFKDDLETVKTYTELFNISQPRRMKSRMPIDRVVDNLYRKKRPYRRRKPYIGPPDRCYRCRLPVPVIHLINKHEQLGFSSPAMMIEAGLRLVSASA